MVSKDLKCDTRILGHATRQYSSNQVNLIVYRKVKMFGGMQYYFYSLKIWHRLKFKKNNNEKNGMYHWDNNLTKWQIIDECFKWVFNTARKFHFQRRFSAGPLTHVIYVTSKQQLLIGHLNWYERELKNLSKLST